jgi:hypothetical protein
VNTYTTGQQRGPTVVMNGFGDVVVIWSTFGQFVPGYAYGARRIGPQLGGEEVNLDDGLTNAAGGVPRVAFTGPGSLIAVWVGQISGSFTEIFARRLLIEPTSTSTLTSTTTSRTTTCTTTSTAAPTSTTTTTLPTSPISGRKLLVADDVDETRRRVVLQSRAAGIDTTAGTGIDPVAAGALLHLYSPDTADSACLPLPASGWMATGNPADPTYRYTDRTYANGPCRAAVVRDGKVLSVVCRATVRPITYSLDEPIQANVVAAFTSGATRYCALFGGTTRYVVGRSFRARNAPAPSVCPTPPAPCP